MKNKKQIKPKTSNYSTKKWIISLSIFGIIGVGAAVVLPLVMCNKQKPSTSVYTAEPVNKFLDTNITETPLVTKLNNSQVISNDFVSYEVENSYNKFINTYKDDNGNWQVR
jgi:flagellar basal body-associated protein FliL